MKMTSQSKQQRITENLDERKMNRNIKNISQIKLERAEVDLWINHEIFAYINLETPGNKINMWFPEDLCVPGRRYVMCHILKEINMVLPGIDFEAIDRNAENALQRSIKRPNTSWVKNTLNNIYLIVLPSNFPRMNVYRKEDERHLSKIKDVLRIIALSITEMWRIESIQFANMAD